VHVPLGPSIAPHSVLRVQSLEWVVPTLYPFRMDSDHAPQKATAISHPRTPPYQRARIVSAGGTRAGLCRVGMMVEYGNALPDFRWRCGYGLREVSRSRRRGQRLAEWGMRALVVAERWLLYMYGSFPGRAPGVVVRGSVGVGVCSCGRGRCRRGRGPAVLGWVLGCPI
jgi:hypothetical protein